MNSKIFICLCNTNLCSSKNTIQLQFKSIATVLQTCKMLISTFWSKDYVYQMMFKIHNTYVCNNCGLLSYVIKPYMYSGCHGKITLAGTAMQFEYTYICIVYTHVWNRKAINKILQIYFKYKYIIYFLTMVSDGLNMFLYLSYLFTQTNNISSPQCNVFS